MKIKRRTKIILVISVLIAMWIVSFLFPQLTIRRYMLTRLHLISTFTSNISSMDRYDKEYGHLYNVEGFDDWSTGESVNVFYLKKFGVFWIVSSVGGAP